MAKSRKAAIDGENYKMVILVQSEGEAYSCETSLAPLSEITTVLKKSHPTGLLRIVSA